MSGSNGYSTMEQAGGGVQNNLTPPPQQSGSSGSSGFQFSSLIPTGVSTALDFMGMFVQDWLNRRSSDRQHAQNIADWKMQNEYNSPAAQMARLRQAGLNPNLIYSQLSNGQSTLNATSSHPASAAGAGDMTSVNNALMAKLQSKMIQSEIENLDADTERKREEAKDIREKRPIYIEHMNADTFFKYNQSGTEYQRGLSVALRNFADGYIPDGLQDGGDITYQSVYKHLNKADSIISQIADERELTHYDVRYMRDLYVDMVKHDREQFEFDLRQWKKDSAVLEYMSEHEWAQFADYIVSRLASVAVQTGIAYRSFSGHRRR